MKNSSFWKDLPFSSEITDYLSRWHIPTRKEFVNWWRKNGLVAILALFSATVIYIAVQEKITQKVYTAKVSIRGGENDSGKLFATKPATVEVTLSGPFSEFQLFDASQLEIALPGSSVKDLGPGMTTYLDINNHHVKGTSVLRVLKIKPDKVLVSSDTRVARSFQIATPRMEVLKPFKGHAEIQVRPNRANVSGWNSQLEALASSGAMLELKPIRVDGSVPSFTQEVDVYPPETDGKRPMTITPSRVAVTVNIVPDTIERILSNVTVNASVPAGSAFPVGYSLSHSHVALALTGQEESISALTHKDVRAYVDIPTFTNRPGKTVLPVHVFFQPNVMASSVKVMPQNITLLPPPVTTIKVAKPIKRKEAFLPPSTNVPSLVRTPSVSKTNAVPAMK